MRGLRWMVWVAPVALVRLFRYASEIPAAACLGKAQPGFCGGQPSSRLFGMSGSSVSPSEQVFLFRTS
jgi:hypothetical protein